VRRNTPDISSNRDLHFWRKLRSKSSWKNVKHIHVHINWGHAVVQLVEALRYKPKGFGFDSRWYHWNFLFNWYFRPHSHSGVDPFSTRNKYHEYLLGVKAAGAYSWQTYHLNLPNILKYGNLNLLETSGTVQACKAIASAWRINYCKVLSKYPELWV
jgi:hypothetical protein